ncbi:MAG: RDD family protein [Nocardioidaceae bacterium]|nr:RDD family protein [Nocardioidaceae bacterium]
MTDIQGETSATRAPGWYRDPAPANPAFPTTVRYWDGSEWTGRTRPAKKAERQSWQAELAAEQHARAVAQAERLSRMATPEQIAAMAQAQSRLTTDDGQELSGWWRRARAAWVDGIIVRTLTLAFGWVFVELVMAAYRSYDEQVVSAVQAGAETPDPTGLLQAAGSALVALVVIGWVVSFLYHVGFLKGFNATPGKMLFGIEVRLRSRPGVLPWRTVLIRWVVRYAGSIVGIFPVVGLFSWIYTLLNYLWPLWDPRRQALHDHAAGTQVCRR